MYRKIAPRFSLPPGQARQVALEISSHTGLLIEGPMDHFEFCHLSLQEYLCADHLIRAPLSGLPDSLLADHPAVCAVAASLSSDPTAWVGTLVHAAPVGQRAAAEFLSRLGQERPRFTPSVDIAGAVLWLFMTARSIDADVVTALYDNPGLKGAIRGLLDDAVRRGQEHTSIRVSDSLARRRPRLPEYLVVSNRIIDKWM